MNKYLSPRSAVLSLLALAFVAMPRLAVGETVQVYILLGQSNMVGAGTVAGTTDGTLEYAVYNKGLYSYLNDGGDWSVRDDVRHVRVMSSGLGDMGVYNNEWMSVGSDDNTIGPEYGIGHALGNAVDAPVMVLKSCIGNRSLGWDLLPPGSERFQYNDGTTNWTYAGYGDYDNRWSDADPYDPTDAGGWRAGVQYDGDVRNAKTVLADLDTYFPGATDYEVAGFFFWQGDKDRYSDAYSDRYEQNLVQLIEQLRIEFDAPNANFVCATLGQTQIGDGGNEGDILDAQFAVSDPEQYPQFEGTVATVYSNPLSLGGASNSHYNNNAETYMNVGEAMGQAMVSLPTLPHVLVDRQTGEIKIVNPADGDINMGLKSLSITSGMGALNPANWTAIAGNYDLDGNGLVDDDGNWTVTAATNVELSETAEAGGGDGLISIAQEVSLGVGAWIRNPARDVRFTYTDANGVEKPLSVRYVGTPTPMADLNFDGVVDALDWPVFLAGNQTDLEGLSAAQAYQYGDLDGDGDSDIWDFALFREAFEAANPAAGAFEEMVAAYVPEPGSILLLAFGAAGLAGRRRRKGFLTVAVAAVASVALIAPCANAATMTNSSTAPAVDGEDIASYGTPTSQDKWWPGSTTVYGTPGKTVGQTFTTGSQGVELNAVTFQIRDGTAPTKEYAIRVGTVSGTTFDTVATESATQGFSTADDDYWTWTFDTPIFLFPDTVYGVDVGLLSSSSEWQTGIPYVYYTADVYPDGTRFRSGTEGNGIGDDSMTATSGDRVFHLDLTAAASPLLTLQVDVFTGDAAIVGYATRDTDINYYQISSEGDSLDAENWVSLDDQGFDGSVWEEAGGVGPHALAEAYLLGSSTISAAQTVGLGKGYDCGVGAEDLVFTYRTDTGRILEGLVEYMSSAPSGDVNADGVVDAADYMMIKRTLGGEPSGAGTGGDLNGDGAVDLTDLDALAYAMGAGGAGGTVPEPGSVLLLGAGLAGLAGRVRKGRLRNL